MFDNLKSAFKALIHPMWRKYDSPSFLLAEKSMTLLGLHRQGRVKLSPQMEAEMNRALMTISAEPMMEAQHTSEYLLHSKTLSKKDIEIIQTKWVADVKKRLDRFNRKG